MSLFADVRYNPTRQRIIAILEFVQVIASQPTNTDEVERACPSCGSNRTEFVRRGYAGLTDTPDQYFTCHECGRVTYEILSRNQREMRMDRIEPGRSIRHDGAEYKVSRVLRAGEDEMLVYLKPSPSKRLRY